MPFELCPRARGFHECQWQCFDSDKAGCTRCGCVHICKDGECEVTLTEEASVCLVTGLCVKDKNFAQDDYSDCIAYKGPSTSCETRNFDYVVVRQVVSHVLKSDQAQEARDSLTDKIIQKITTSIMKQNTSHGNLIDIIEQNFDETLHKFDFPVSLRPEKVESLIDACAHQICITMTIAESQLGLNVKSTEVRDNIIALLYLMRIGIHVGGVVVLPCVKQLQYLLPSENLLWRFFKCKSKNITETENKYKMRIRLTSLSRLQQLPFLTLKHECTWIASVNRIF